MHIKSLGQSYIEPSNKTHDQKKKHRECLYLASGIHQTELIGTTHIHAGKVYNFHIYSDCRIDSLIRTGILPLVHPRGQIEMTADPPMVAVMSPQYPEGGGQYERTSIIILKNRKDLHLY